MKTLILVRHGQAAAPSDDDKSRVLTSAGEAEAKQTAAFLLAQPQLPQYIIHSDAVRTTMTAQVIAQLLHLSSILHAESRLYNAPIDQWLQVLSTIADEHHTVLAVGHNLGISRFAEALVNKYLPEMQTCTAHIIQLPIPTWQAIAPKMGTLLTTFNPS
jgi:phosphohistidine phosphatase